MPSDGSDTDEVSYHEDFDEDDPLNNYPASSSYGGFLGDPPSRYLSSSDSSSSDSESVRDEDDDEHSDPEDGVGPSCSSSTTTTTSPASARPLRAMFYAVFDDESGPRLVARVPEHLRPGPRGSREDDVLTNMSSGIIPGPEFCNKLVTVQSKGLQVCSYPMILYSPNYHRHHFYFAFGMVLRRGEDAGPYKPVLRKLGRVFRDLEQDCAFLTTETTSRLVKPILARVLEDLEARGECIFRVASRLFALKLFPRLLEPPDVPDYCVPVLTQDLKPYMTKSWDATIQRLLPHLDGKKFVKRIAVEAEVEPWLVRQCVRQLIYYRAVYVVDVFQYSNFYCVTPRIARLVDDEAMQLECLRSLGVLSGRAVGLESGASSSSSFRGSTTPMKRSAAPKLHSHHFAPQREDLALFPRVFQLYAAIHAGAPFGHFCLEQAAERRELDVDDVAFVRFGVKSGVLRRVRNTPVVAMTTMGRVANINSAGGAAEANESVRRLIDGERDLDEICATTHKGSAEALIVCRSFPNVVVVKR